MENQLNIYKKEPYKLNAKNIIDDIKTILTMYDVIKDYKVNILIADYIGLQISIRDGEYLSLSKYDDRWVIEYYKQDVCNLTYYYDKQLELVLGYTYKELYDLACQITNYNSSDEPKY